MLEIAQAKEMALDLTYEGYIDLRNTIIASDPIISNEPITSEKLAHMCQLHDILSEMGNMLEEGIKLLTYDVRALPVIIYRGVEKIRVFSTRNPEKNWVFLGKSLIYEGPKFFTDAWVSPDGKVFLGGTHTPVYQVINGELVQLSKRRAEIVCGGGTAIFFNDDMAVLCGEQGFCPVPVPMSRPVYYHGAWFIATIEKSKSNESLLVIKRVSLMGEVTKEFVVDEVIPEIGYILDNPLRVKNGLLNLKQPISRRGSHVWADLFLNESLEVYSLEVGEKYNYFSW